jgi:asparagine synthase (glutamine-hydrolysing)
MLIDVDGVHIQRYWQIDPDHRIPVTSETETGERVYELMIDAVRRRLPVTGPYACALTGGFDSGSVAGLLRRALCERGINDTLETFSFEMRDPESDEPELIDAVAREVRANHHHIYMDRDNVFEVLPDLVTLGGEPTRDMGMLYLWRKKERAAKDVRVVMSGLGGDELFFGGYQYLADLLRAGRFGELWRELRPLTPVDPISGKPTSLSSLSWNYVLAPLLPRPIKTLGRRVLLGERLVRPWVRRDFAERVNLRDRVSQSPARVFNDIYREYCFQEFQQILVNLALPMHEALGAHFRVDTRFPLLDRKLVEFMFAAPREAKIKQGRTRIAQRSAMTGILPDFVVQDHRKKNLHPVLWRQQRGNFLHALTSLFGARTRLCEEYLDREELRRIYERYLAHDDRKAGQVLWHALNLEEWLRQRTG